jgi:predicted nuclease of predicted toxin-antitoxin system
MARFYSNENFPLPVVRLLRGLGHDVLTTREAGKDNQKIPDEEVVAFAHSQQRWVLTLNRMDFIYIHQRGQPHSGIIVCKADKDLQGQVEKIHAAVLTSQVDRPLIRISRGSK